MLKKLKQSWYRFQLNAPGQRFQKRYELHRKSAHGVLLRIFFISAGLLLVVVGIFFLPAPGPGLIIVFVGASLLAQESLWMARALDEAELVLRDVYAWNVRWWRAASFVPKAILGFIALILMTTFAFGVYQILFAS